MSTSSKRENNTPIVVGLTGGIGSGKSTIAKVFEALNVPVFNSDLEAKNIINTDSDVVSQISNEFGDVYAGRQVDRVKMAEIVFKDKTALEKLNNIVHPRVAEVFDDWVGQNVNAPIVIKEAAILIESGAYKQMDKIVLVTAPEDIRVQRVMGRDTVSEEKVKERMGTQLSDQEKQKYADYIISNSDNELVIPQVLDTYNQLIS